MAIHLFLNPPEYPWTNGWLSIKKQSHMINYHWRYHKVQDSALLTFPNWQTEFFITYCFVFSVPYWNICYQKASPHFCRFFPRTIILILILKKLNVKLWQLFVLKLAWKAYKSRFFIFIKNILILGGWRW
jgi:hypothetical protein